MDDASDYAATVRRTYGADAKPAGRAPAKTIQFESEAEAQKRRDEANEDPLNREMRLKREAKKNAETPPAGTASASPTPTVGNPPNTPSLGGLAAGIAKNRAAAAK